MTDGWEPLLEDLARRRDAARAMGGAARLARQRLGGRLDARARIDALCDPGSFRELGVLVGSSDGAAADGLITGIGRLDGRVVAIGAEDFTVLGGSIGPGTAAKRFRIAEMAGAERIPLVFLLDGAGARANNSTQRHARAPGDLQMVASLSGVVPMVAVVMGPSAGHGALVAPLMDVTFMVQGAAIFAAGPPLVASSTGEVVDKETLGGAATQVASGVVHNVASTDVDALALVRRYLSFFPSSAWSVPPSSLDLPIMTAQSGGQDAQAHGRESDMGPRRLDAILHVIPASGTRPYDMGNVLDLVADDSDWLELQPGYGRSLITALARLGGHPVMVIANQPKVKAGAIDAAAAEKAAHMIELADAYRLPLVFLTDNPGVMAGSAAERSAILRAGARMYSAQHRATTVKLHVTFRKAFGFGSSAMAMNPFDGQTISYCFPGVRLGAMPGRGASRATGATGEAEAALIAADLAGGYRAAENLSFDEMIDPRDLRNALLDGLTMAAGRLGPDVANGPVRRSGIRP